MYSVTFPYWLKKKKERKDLKIQEKVGKIFDMDIKVF